MTLPPPQPTALISRGSGESLVEQIVRSITSRIDDKLLRTAARMPSIRQFAEQNKVSRFTVVEAYDRLVANGYLESRRGSGFYVRERAQMMAASRSRQDTDVRPAQQLDVVWLIRNMFRQLPPQKMPGTGLLPNDWLDGELIANGLRAVSRQNQNPLLQYGTPQGFLPLRQLHPRRPPACRYRHPHEYADQFQFRPRAARRILWRWWRHRRDQKCRRLCRSADTKTCSYFRLRPTLPR